jgi:hypothetical protein
MFLSFLLSLFYYLCLLIVLCFKPLLCMDFLSSYLNVWYLISSCSVISLLWVFHGNRQFSFIGLFLGYVQAVFNESVLVLGADMLVCSSMGLICGIMLKWRCLTASRKDIRLVPDSDPTQMDTHFLQVFSYHYPIKMELVSNVSETILRLHLQDLRRQMTRTYTLFIRKKYFGFVLSQSVALQASNDKCLPCVPCRSHEIWSIWSVLK